MSSQNTKGLRIIKVEAQTRSKKSRLGRPTKEESKRRHQKMLDSALDIFLERGYEQTTMLEIANAVGMSKQTIYAAYSDKEALFLATVKKAVERYTVPLKSFKAIASDDLEEVLSRVAKIRLDNLATPTGIKLQRILIFQSFRFPGLDRASFEESNGPTIEFLSTVFERFHTTGEVTVEEPKRAAIAFISLISGGPFRIFLSGSTLAEDELQKHIRFTVNLFLDGIRRR